MRIWRELSLFISFAAFASSVAAPANEPKAPVETVGVWQAPAGARQVPIWPGAAPDGTFRPQPPESV